MTGLLNNPKAVVLLSGGLDSTTTLAIAQSLGFETFALTFKYGQRHEIEIDAAKKIAQKFSVSKHNIAEIDLRAFGGSSLTSSMPVPKGRSVAEMNDEIPSTYVPARNTIFLSFALAWAEVLGAADIFIGVNAVDYSGYPDCRPSFIEAFESLANLATRAGVEETTKIKIHTPLIALSKSEIIKTGLALRVDYSLTTSCYEPAEDGKACGECDACRLRLAGFEQSGKVDPIPYQNESQSENDD